MARKALLWSMFMGLASFSFLLIHVFGEQPQVGQFSGGHYHDQMRKMQAFKASFVRHDSIALSPSISPSPSAAQQPPVPIPAFLLKL